MTGQPDSDDEPSTEWTLMGDDVLFSRVGPHDYKLFLDAQISEKYKERRWLLEERRRLLERQGHLLDRLSEVNDTLGWSLSEYNGISEDDHPLTADIEADDSRLTGVDTALGGPEARRRQEVLSVIEEVADAFDDRVPREDIIELCKLEHDIPEQEVRDLITDLIVRGKIYQQDRSYVKLSQDWHRSVWERDSQSG